MDIKKFIISASSYPRYSYNSLETVRFFKRFNLLLKKTELKSQNYPIPKYTDPDIFVIRHIEENSFTESRLQYTNRKNQIKVLQTLTSLEDLQKENIDRTSEKVVILFTSGFPEVLSYLEEIALNSIVVGTSKENVAQIKGKYSFFNRDSVPLITMNETNTLAEAVDSVLERIVFRRLYSLLEVLKDFKEVDRKTLIVDGLRNHLEGYMNSFGQRIPRGWMQEIKDILEKTEDKSIKRILQALDNANEKSLTENKSVYLLFDRTAVDMSKKMEQFIHDQFKRIPYTIRDMLPPKLEEVGAIEESLYKVTINLLVKFYKQDESADEAIHDEVTVVVKQLKDNREELIKVLEHAASQLKIVTEADRRIKNVKDLYESSFHRLTWEIKGSFYRSKVPPSEQPSTGNESKSLSPRVARRLFDKIGAVGAGYRCDKLHVYVREESDIDESKVKSDVQKVLAEFHITEFRLILSKETVTHFKRVGAKIKVARKGTLGGFAWMNAGQQGNGETIYRREERQLCALMSKHVVNGTDLVYWLPEKSNDEIKIGSVIQVQENPSNFHNPYVDIAAARILPMQEQICDVKFRNSRQEPSRCKLFDFYDTSYLEGLTVHFSGATTKLGIGKVTIPDFICPPSGSTQRTEIHYVVIEDIEEDDDGNIVRFSEEGDSGAVICADRMGGEHVDVIAMLIGCMNFTDREDKNTPGKYLTFRMKDGLEKLESETKYSFTLCTD